MMNLSIGGPFHILILRPGDAGDGRQWRMTLMLLQNALVWQLQPDVMSWTMVRHGGRLKGWLKQPS